MEFLGIKIGDQVLLANPFYLQVLLVIIALALIKIAFGKEIVSLAKKFGVVLPVGTKIKSILTGLQIVFKERVGSKKETPYH